MIKELTKKLQEEKEQKRKVVAVFDKRIKNLEKAIHSINNYNNEYVNVIETLESVEVGTIEEDEYED